MKRISGVVLLSSSARLLLALVLIVSVGCSGEEAEHPPLVVWDSAGIDIVSNNLDRNDATCRISQEATLSIGTVEGNSDYELYRVFGARQLSDGRIALINQGSQELRFYGSDGRFLRSTGRSGSGPGEFQNAFHLWVLPGDTIWVGDYRPWEFEVFSPGGEWVRRVQPHPLYHNVPEVIAVLHDGRMVLAERPIHDAPMNQFELRSLTVLLHGSDGVITDTVGRYPHGSVGRFEEWPSFISRPMFESIAHVAAGDRQIVVGHASAPEFRVLRVSEDAGVNLERIVRWSARPENVTAADVEAERARLAKSMADAPPAMRQQLLEPQITERRPVASNFPVFSSLLVGADGRTWVRSYRRPGSDQLDQWLLFDPAGALECRLAMRSFSQVLEVGRDYILVLDRDELGVEQVQRYAVEK